MIARTIALIARGDRDTKSQEMIWVDPIRVYPFLGIDTKNLPTEIDVGKVWEGLFGEKVKETKQRLNPCVLRLKKAVAYALQNSHPTLFANCSNVVRRLLDVREPFDNFRVSPIELLVYVGNAHKYLNGVTEFDRNGIHQESLIRAQSALSEAVTPRLDKRLTFSTNESFLRAVQKNDFEHVLTLWLAPHSIEPDAPQDGIGRTGLIWACRRGYIQMVDLLLACGVNPNHMAREMGDPLIWSSSYAQPQSCKRILRAGGILDSEDDEGTKPIESVGRFIGVQNLLFEHMSSNIENLSTVRDPYAPNPYHTDMILRQA